MKQFLCFLLVSVLFYSCKVKEAPEFVTVKNIKVVETNSEFITLSANAIFKNPNVLGGKLQTEGIDVFVNNDLVANVVTEEFKVPAKEEFTIPLTAKVETKKLVSKQNLGSILSSFINQNLEVKYSGDIKYKILGFSHTYTVDQTETIKLKL